LGGNEKGSITSHAPLEEESLEESIERVEKALPIIIAAYDDEQKAYDAVPEFRFAPRYHDYAHLERLQEWMD